MTAIKRIFVTAAELEAFRLATPRFGMTSGGNQIKEAADYVVSLGKRIEAERRGRNFQSSLTQDQRTIHDALCDSAWLAGLTAGWNAGMIKDEAAAGEELSRLKNSRRGHLSGINEALQRIATLGEEIDV